MNEREIIECITKHSSTECSDLIQSIGDDCAVVKKDEENVWLLTMDTLVESVHFNLAWHPPELLGRKTISVNASDIASMGGTPRFALLSLGAPKPVDDEWIHAFSRGIETASRDYGCFVIGGDTVYSPYGYSISLSLIGEAPATKVRYRHGAKPGDQIWVSGYLGEAAAGLELYQQNRVSMEHYSELYAAHLDPVARVELGKAMAGLKQVHSMMDLSDGIATDLAHLCKRSTVGARLERQRLPISTATLLACEELSLSPVSLAVRGGEDFELLFTASTAAEQNIRDIGHRLNIHLSVVGEIIEGENVVLHDLNVDGSQHFEILSYQGFDHFRDE
ncbi:thiamine-phosphate kinase [Desulfogranum japonicum]|uniref:thiamine-phosphate kinase n=1 Tax=Desulfogranum japonicum TaxID=231447 RepID=UPI0003F92E2F|nr:thiamine-phosphate kinase [Desulfogranum japonicum]